LPATAEDLPHYRHVVVIVDENKDLSAIVGASAAPNMTAWAATYGVATHYDAVAHPSEPNYVALVGGSTFGITDDGSILVNTVRAPNLATQIEAAHLQWKGYYESIPAPGSLAIYSGLYAAKHSGFLNFENVREDPQRDRRIVGFDQLYRDLKSGAFPNFALVVPNLCNDMHGVSGPNVRDDCRTWHPAALVARGDAAAKTIVTAIMSSTVWRQSAGTAIVIVFDEDDSGSTEGGGGRVPAIVMTNHGPRHVRDATPYSHYSLVRTIEDVLGLRGHLAHAADPGVKAMLPLFYGVRR
jgi:phosphatidylinositol-3-phosphatase